MAQAMGGDSGLKRDLTLIQPYYDNPLMFREQQKVWSRYAPELRERLHVIVVDDCSPTWPALPNVRQAGIASFRLYRTLKDIPWNWLFCRNLGVQETQTEWLLMTDMDHVMPEATLRGLLERSFSPELVYRLSRIDAPNLTPYKPHPNTFFMTKAMFDRIGGYDERMSGYYGTDGEWNKRIRVNIGENNIVLLDLPLIRYGREVIQDASTTRYSRKDASRRMILRQMQADRDARHLKPIRVTFPYERLV
jgi:hypothetical protein